MRLVQAAQQMKMFKDSQNPFGQKFAIFLLVKNFILKLSDLYSMRVQKDLDPVLPHLHHLQVNGWFVASGLVALKLSTATTQAGGHYELQ